MKDKTKTNMDNGKKRRKKQLAKTETKIKKVTNKKKENAVFVSFHAFSNYHPNVNHRRINSIKVKICICDVKIISAKPKSASVTKINSPNNFVLSVLISVSMVLLFLYHVGGGGVERSFTSSPPPSPRFP